MNGIAPGMETDAWVVRWQPVPAARLRLFCLPHSGGGAAAYRPWAHELRQLVSGVELIAIQLPGRGNRLEEPPFTSIDELAPVLVRSVEPWLDRPHAWFGHSLGALVAFEACRAMRRLALAEPVRLLVSGSPAPHRAELGRPSVRDAPAADLIAWLRGLGGTPQEVLDDAALLPALLPMLRADLTMVETYQCRPEPPLDCPISVFGGADDPSATVAELHAWRRHSTDCCAVRVLPGGHFFLHEAREHVLSAIAADLLNSLSGSMR